MDERGKDIRKILSEGGRGITVPLIPSWSGDEGPAMMAERTNEDPRKGRADCADDAGGRQNELGGKILL